MRWSQSCLPTLKENPREAEIPSHRLMLRAGLIKKLTSGVYTFLPAGLRVVRKIERIVREEMDAIGCQEILMPILHPSEIYEESGRMQNFGPELFKLHDRRGRLFALGPTHEEVVTMIARDDMRSYRDLPQSLYQILTKFRDEIRPSFGVIRAREFMMKDAYSFHVDDRSLELTYQDMARAYARIIERCGLEYAKVEAESGYIGGNESHEFMVLADSGEDTILGCPCGYAVNLERAVAREAGRIETGGADRTPQRVETPAMTTVEEVSSFLGVEPGALVKTMLYRSGDRNIAVLVPGDREVNDIKLVRVTDDPAIRFLEPDEIEELTGAPVGFSGPIGLPAETVVLADHLVSRYESMIVGANEKDAHIVGARPERDFRIDRFEDLVFAREGDLCPRCGKPLGESHGVEVGHIFKLGTKYSSAMNATFLDESGTARPFVMGCYGFGISRMVAAAIEQNHDSDGIIWPASIAPFDLHILPVNVTDAAVMGAADRFVEAFESRGLEVIVDDRDQSPGVKFKDADLLGVPLRLTIGRKLKEGKVELYRRGTKEVEELAADDVVQSVCGGMRG